MRNLLFLAGRIELVQGLDQRSMLRVIAYEMPLKPRGQRTNCVDLFAYDSAHRPCLIELKCEDSQDRPEQVIRKISKYAALFRDRRLRQAAQNQLREALLWPDFELSGSAQGLILAPCEFYRRFARDWAGHLAGDIGIYRLPGNYRTAFTRPRGVVAARRVRQCWLKGLQS